MVVKKYGNDATMLYFITLCVGVCMCVGVQRNFGKLFMVCLLKGKYRRDMRETTIAETTITPDAVSTLDTLTSTHTNTIYTHTHTHAL